MTESKIQNNSIIKGTHISSEVSIKTLATIIVVSGTGTKDFLVSDISQATNGIITDSSKIIGIAHFSPTETGYYVIGARTNAAHTGMVIEFNAALPSGQTQVLGMVITYYE